MAYHNSGRVDGKEWRSAGPTVNTVPHLIRSNDDIGISRERQFNGDLRKEAFLQDVFVFVFSFKNTSCSPPHASYLQWGVCSKPHASTPSPEHQFYIGNANRMV